MFILSITTVKNTKNHSFLTEHEQVLKSSKQISSPYQLKSGVPQGRNISPIIFTVYSADLEEWVRHSKLINLTDNTSTSHSVKDLEMGLKT